ncbi:tetratricopeptide (TPR) repeat protein [Nitrospina gracilis]|nr:MULTISPECIES: tetratricopeptide repeat protein [Nitrospina]MCF8722284.1 tetratricopeptide (TPR) repeat protein [Nitrospina sp. Nb-3]
MPTLYFTLNTHHLQQLIAPITEECNVILHADCIWATPEETPPTPEVRRRMKRSDVLIVAIGPAGSGASQLNERMREEIGTAVNGDLVLIPLLIDDARLPGKDEAGGVWKWLLNMKTHRLRTKRWSEDLNEILAEIEAELNFRREVMEKVSKAGPGPLPEVKDAEGNPLEPPRMGLEFSGVQELRRTIDAEHNSLGRARQSGDREEEKQALGALGLAYAQLGQTQRAIECFEQQLSIVRELNGAREECELLANLGDAYAVSGNLDHAKKYYEEQLCRADELDIPAFIGSAYNGLGHVFVKRGKLDRAIDCYRRALKHYRDLEDHDKELELLVGIGLNQEKKGDLTRAAETLEQAKMSARFVENRKEEARLNVDLAELYKSLNEPRRALDCLSDAEAILNLFEGNWTDPWKSRIASLRSQMKTA